MLDRIVINTGPLIALVAAWGDLTLLSLLYRQVLVPLEVKREIEAGGRKQFAVAEFAESDVLKIWPHELRITPLLANSLDLGEAAVIQLALDEGVQTVCIDEAVGRRFARLSGLSLTGSVGILVRAKREGATFSMSTALEQMKAHGIWLSERVVNFALSQEDELQNP